MLFTYNGYMTFRGRIRGGGYIEPFVIAYYAACIIADFALRSSTLSVWQ